MAANKDKEKDLETTEETITTEVDKPAKKSGTKKTKKLSVLPPPKVKLVPAFII